MYGFFADKTDLYMVLEYMEGGTLFSKLKNQIKLTEKQTAEVVRQIAKAVEYLHDRGIAHRDIKP
jgi:serine/threonine protein kinase